MPYDQASIGTFAVSGSSAHQQAVVVQLRGGGQQVGGRFGPALLDQQPRQERRPLQCLRGSLRGNHGLLHREQQRGSSSTGAPAKARHAVFTELLTTWRSLPAFA